MRVTKNDPNGAWCICADFRSVGPSEGCFSLRGNSMNSAERCLIADEKVPIQGGERTGGFSCANRWRKGTTFTEVRHLVEVITTRDIGLGGGPPAIGKRPHANHIGLHHPLGTVNVRTSHPPRECVRVDAGEGCGIGQHHETLNVMVPGVIVEVADYAIEAAHLMASHLLP